MNTSMQTYHPEAEESVVGSIWIDPPTLGAVAEICSPDDFYLERCRWVYEAMLALWQRGEPIDPLTLSNELERQGKLAEVGGITHLSHLETMVPSAMNATAYARIVRDDASRRRMMDELSAIGQMTLADQFDLGLVIEQAQERLARLWPNGHQRWCSLTLADALTPRQVLPQVVSGILPRRSLSIWFGASGDLKSNLLSDLCMAVATGTPWLPGMPEHDNSGGFPVTACPVLWVDVDNGRDVTAERLAAFARAYRAPSDAPVYWLSFPTPPIVASHGLRKLSEHAAGLGAGLIVIDNLLRVAGVRDENASEVDLAMGNLRKLAEDTGAAVAVIHHRRKDISGREGDSIRGHSSIEASLDSAFLVKRSEGRDAVTVKHTKARRKKVATFGAVFTYEHEPDGETLHAARFYRAAPEQAQIREHYSKSEEYVLRYLGEYAESLLAEIMTHADTCTSNAARQAVYSLTRRGKVRRVDDGGPGERAIYGLVRDSVDGRSQEAVV